ncbi:MAG: sulfatase-like hydrolase/transferase [Verrucomicrobiales bacterium]|nr:sulfatase-like hydrolase/transferase [Verrucomicrobiales bacterium]
MNQRIFLLFSFLVSLAVARADEQPNVIFIIADDLGYGELSIQNPDTDVPTPHIDSIATNGVQFTDGYVSAPFCAASRAGLITGKYQTRFGFEFNPIGARNEDPDAGLPPKELTLADRLRDEAGYTTAMIGKWHLGGTAHYNPIRRGFDEFYGFLHEGRYFRPRPYEGMTTWLRRKVLPGGKTGRWISDDGTLIYSTHMGHNEPDYDADNPVYRDGQPIEEPENLTDAITREAVSFVQRCGDERPFFLYLAYNAVHSPLQGEAVYVEKYAGIEDIQRRIFAAMLGHLDDGVGKLLEVVKAEGIWDNTMIVFLSDNGGPTRELTSSNLPLKGEKGRLNEGGIRVPFLLQYPAKVEAGQVYEEPITSLDLYPTSIEMAGLEAKGLTDGVDLIPYLSGEEAGAPHESLFWRVGGRAALRKGDWKIVREGRRDKSKVSPWELYNLHEDVGETNDLASTEKEILKDLVEEWEKLDQEMIEPVF